MESERYIPPEPKILRWIQECRKADWIEEQEKLKRSKRWIDFNSLIVTSSVLVTLFMESLWVARGKPAFWETTPVQVLNNELKISLYSSCINAETDQPSPYRVSIRLSGEKTDTTDQDLTLITSPGSSPSSLALTHIVWTNDGFYVQTRGDQVSRHRAIEGQVFMTDNYPQYLYLYPGNLQTKDVSKTPLIADPIHINQSTCD